MAKETLHWLADCNSWLQKNSFRRNKIKNCCTLFKACVRYFLWNFYFSPNDSPLKLWKMFFFNLKSSFRSQDIQIFGYLSSPLFFPVSRCFRGWSKKNLKVYDVINSLDKNLITHFVWYFEKEMRCDIKTLSIDRILRNIFMEKSCRNCAPKASPFLILLNNPKQSLHARNSFKKEIFWNRDSKKP